MRGKRKSITPSLELKRAILLLKNSKTKKRGVKLLKELSKLGNDQSSLELALENASGEKVMSKDVMIKWLEHFHKRGDSRATLSLAYCYDQGFGVNRNIRKAFLLNQQAAKSGQVDAFWNLALFYEKGIGCRKDLSEAFKWYKKAAEKGDAEAINSLGYCYKYGLGTRKSYTKALELFRKACRKGNPSAYSNLGSMYLSGFGVKRSEVKAERYLKKGASLGSKLGKELLLDLK